MTNPARPNISFGTDGWRGIIADNFTGANVRLVSQAIANYFARADVPGEPVVFIGYDNRSQSEYFAREAAKVVAAAGLKAVLSDGSCSSPSVSFQAHKANAKGGVMITASHNPPQFNGVKIKMGFGGSALPSDVAEVVSELNALMDAGTFAIDPDPSAADRVETRDFRPAYFDGLRAMVDFEKIAAGGFSIVADPMHGSGSGYLTALARGAGIRLNEICTERNPVFGGLNPEPIAVNLGPLRDAVLAQKADVGLAIDGDADRVGAMDASGAFVDPHRIFCLILRHLYEDKGQRGSVVKTVSGTKLIDKMCAKYGLTLHVTPIGFKNIAEYMLKEPVLIGGEESGGIGVLGFIPERDGPLMSLLLLETMATRKKRLEEQIAELMAEFGPHEYGRIDLHPEASKMAAVVQSLTQDNPTQLAGLAVQSVDRTDGTKFNLPDDAWLLLRASGTEPIVRVYAEAASQEKVQALLDAGVGLVERV